MSVRFGGIVAVDNVTLDVPAGGVTGLIGPNGAGKTTTFNACTGLTKLSNGAVEMLGEDISGRSPSHRAQLGLGRTFQRMELFDSLTVAENVAIGREASLAGSNPVAHVLGRRGDRRLVRAVTDDALELCGITLLRDRRAGLLSTGQRRLVELARVLAGPFRILLLDEPSSGLDSHETERFGEILQTVVDERDVAVLLVEHDMTLVMRVCSFVYVLDFGKLVFQGTATELADSAVVRDAYLGSTALHAELAAP